MADKQIPLSLADSHGRQTGRLSDLLSRAGGLFPLRCKTNLKIVVPSFLPVGISILVAGSYQGGRPPDGKVIRPRSNPLSQLRDHALIESTLIWPINYCQPASHGANNDNNKKRPTTSKTNRLVPAEWIQPTTD